jgi:hypothetical protein
MKKRFAGSPTLLTTGFPATVFETDPLLEPIRGEPRFRTLMGELPAECDGFRRLYEELRGSASPAASAT